MKCLHIAWMIACLVVWAVLPVTFALEVQTTRPANGTRRSLASSIETLLKRAHVPQQGPSAAEWAHMVEKGAGLRCMMYYDDRVAGQVFRPPRDSAHGPFTNFPYEFDKWGYFRDDDAERRLGQWYYGLHEAFRGLRISMAGTDWKFWRIIHANYADETPISEQTYVANGYTYRATGAYYVMPVNRKDGVIIHAKLHSPRSEAAKRIPPLPENQLPDLQRSSDITWGAWSMTPGNALTVKHIFSWAIQNEPTLKAIRQALTLLSASVWAINFWPGLEVPVDSEAGKGLIGSPVGAAVALFLAQHKYPLGNRQITKIRIFELDSYAFQEMTYPTIYWEIGPAPAPATT